MKIFQNLPPAQAPQRAKRTADDMTQNSGNVSTLVNSPDQKQVTAISTPVSQNLILNLYSHEVADIDTVHHLLADSAEEPATANTNESTTHDSNSPPKRLRVLI